MNIKEAAIKKWILLYTYLYTCIPTFYLIDFKWGCALVNVNHKSYFFQWIVHQNEFLRSGKVCVHTPLINYNAGIYIVHLYHNKCEQCSSQNIIIINKLLLITKGVLWTIFFTLHIELSFSLLFFYISMYNLFATLNIKHIKPSKLILHTSEWGTAQAYK